VFCSMGEPGKVPGISSLSWSDASLAGTVRGARVDWVSWERETLLTGYILGSVDLTWDAVSRVDIPAAWPSLCSKVWLSGEP
jgi:hypothetical protein